MSFQLFRTEVLTAHRKQAYGEVLLIFPVSNYILVVLAVVILSMLVALAVCGTYTRHVTVAGVLEPEHGVVKLFATQPGVLKTQRVREGQQVHRGDVLLVFISEHAGSNGKSVETALNEQLEERLATLHSELGDTLKLQQASAHRSQAELEAQLTNLRNLQNQRRTQNERTQSAAKMYERYQALQRAGFVPDIQVQQKHDDLLDQQIRLQSLNKDILTAEVDIANLRHALATIPLQAEVTKAQLQRNISSSESELSRQRNDHEWSVVAPCDGTVASLTITSNQTAGQGVPLVTILPSQGQLRATLYAPSQALGFLRPGQRVKIKLDAFPYQKFGFAEGVVATIAESPVLPTEVSPGTRLAALNGPDPLYTINVAVARQFMLAYGRQQALRPGMQLTAEIEIDTRALYEWVLEPLYSMRRS